jgi:hypothetical protein
VSGPLANSAQTTGPAGGIARKIFSDIASESLRRGSDYSSVRVKRLTAAPTHGETIMKTAIVTLASALALGACSTTP